MVKAWKEKVVIPTYEVGKPRRIRFSWRTGVSRQ